ncbi:MAG: hypothetical protein WCL51_04225 [Bacteroidota bacterium]
MIEFDKYSIKARIYPVVIFLLPIVVIGITYSIEYEKYIQVLTTLGITSALVYFLSNIGRDSGKKKEPKLWEKWGGMPSVQLLSFRNDILDKYTKQKYHIKLLELSPIKDQNIDFLNSDLDSVKDVYISWTRYLISMTRDTKKYSLLFKENISYGFRRNLWGLKLKSILIIVITIICNFVFIGIKNGFLNYKIFPINFWISEIILLILLMIWIFMINNKWIKIPAFAYAERLLESIGSINVNNIKIDNKVSNR